MEVNTVDIIVNSEKHEQHTLHLYEDSKQVEIYWLKIKPTKCKFIQN